MFTMTPQVASRLRKTIFNGMSSDIYGKVLGRIGREDAFALARRRLTTMMRQNERISGLHVDELSKFVALAKAGRDHYESEGYSPDEFILLTLLSFAEDLENNLLARAALT